MAYRFTKDDGTVISGVTVRDGIVYGPDGKRFGPISMFPDLQNEKGQRVTIQTARATDDDGNYMDDDPDIIRDDDGETRTSTVTGVTQTGKKLGIGDINGLFASLSNPERKGGAVMTPGDLPSASKFFSEALPTTEAGARQGHEGTRTNYSWDSEPETGKWDEDTGKLIEPTVPGTTGGKPENPEDGTSSKPDIAESVRTIRMHRNKRDQLEGSSADEPFGGVSETKGNGMTAERRAAVSAFLDPRNKGYAAIRAADRAVGTAIGKNGVEGMRIGDEFVAFKPGMGRDARFEARGGKIQSKEDAQDFLKKFTNRLTKPDTSEE